MLLGISLNFPYYACSNLIIDSINALLEYSTILLECVDLLSTIHVLYEQYTLTVLLESIYLF